jgi:hypothetical protein
MRARTPVLGVLLGEGLGRGLTVESYVGSLLGQNALEYYERAVATAVIVPAGVLTVQPGEQPGFVLAVGIERDANREIASNRMRPSHRDRLAASCSAVLVTSTFGGAVGAAAGWAGGVP